MAEMATRRPARPLPPLLKLVVEMGPLALFFAANTRPQFFAAILPGLDASVPNAGIFIATAVFMLATLAALAVSYALTRHLPVMPLVSGIVVMVFGGLTLWLHDEVFIKMKPTIINGLFGAILLGGLAVGKPLISYVLGAVFDLTPEGWRKLTLRWGLFFVALAILNEIVWRNFSTGTWVNFKVFGTMPLTVLFAASQVPLLMRHEVKRDRNE
jgi:intracellular septation protein